MAKKINALAQGRTGAVIYLRVSTDQQARDGIGLDSQLSRCRAIADVRNLTVIATFRDEGISGRAALHLRPGLQTAIAACVEHNAVLIAYSVSRIARRQRLLWELLDPEGTHRLSFLSATEPFDTSTPMGRAMMGMIGVWGQLEADLVSERTKDALAYARAKGTRLGAPSTARLIPEVVSRVEALHDAGHSLRAIANMLNAQGVSTARGGHWWPKTVAHILAESRCIAQSNKS